MVYVPFVHANGDGKGLMLNSDISVANITGGDNEQIADRIWIWNPKDSSYTRFFYYQDENESGWCDDANVEYIQNNKGWEDGIPAGQGMYFKAKGTDKTVTFTSPLAE